MNSWGLGFIFEAKDMATAVINRLERSFGKLGPAAAKAGVGIAAAFVGAKAFTGGLDLLRDAYDFAEPAKKFELSMNNLGVLTNRSGAALKEMSDKALNLGLSTIHGPQKAVDAMMELTKSGKTASEAMSLVDNVLRLITASGGEITEAAEAADILQKVQKTWGLSAELSLDRLAKFANMSSASFGELGTAISKVMRGTGINPDMSETLALLGIVRNMSANMEETGTTVGVMMEHFASIKKMQPFKELGMEIFDRATGAFHGPLDVLRQFYTNPAWNGLDLDKRLDMLGKGFGSRQGKVFQSFFKAMDLGEMTDKGFKKGVELIDHWKTSLDNASGELKKFERAMESSTIGIEKMFQARMQSVQQLIGEALLKVYAPVMRVVGLAMEALGKFFQMLGPEVTEFLTAGAIASVVVFTLAAGVVTLVGAFVALSAIWSIVGSVLVAAILPPLIAVLSVAGAVVGIVGLLGAAFYTIFTKNIAGGAEGMLGFFEKVKLGFQVMGQLFSEGGTFGAVDEAIMDPSNSGLLSFLTNVWMWIGRVKTFLTSMWDGFQKGLQAVDGPFKFLMATFNLFLELLGVSTGSAGENASMFDRWSKAGESLGRILSVLAQVVIVGLGIAMSFLNAAIGTARVGWYLFGDTAMSVFGLIMNIVDLFAALFTGTWSDIGKAVSNVFWGLVKVALNALGIIVKAMGGVMDGIGGMFGVDLGMTNALGGGFDDMNIALSKKQYSDPRSDPAATPAAAALQSQATNSEINMSSMPPINMTVNPQTIVKLEATTIAKAMAAEQRSSDYRGSMSVAPVSSMGR